MEDLQTQLDKVNTKLGSLNGDLRLAKEDAQIASHEFQNVRSAELIGDGSAKETAEAEAKVNGCNMKIANIQRDMLFLERKQVELKEAVKAAAAAEAAATTETMRANAERVYQKQMNTAIRAMGAAIAAHSVIHGVSPHTINPVGFIERIMLMDPAASPAGVGFNGRPQLRQEIDGQMTKLRMTK